MSKFDGLISLQEAADLIGVSSAYLRAEISRGKLVEGIHCGKYGKQWVINKLPFLKKYNRLHSNFEIIHEDNIYWVFHSNEKVIGCSNKASATKWINEHGEAFIECGAIFI